MINMMENEATKSKILLTGVAGFIGYFLAKRLLNEGMQVLGIDNLNDYYDVSLKNYRLENLKTLENFRFVKADISNKLIIEELFRDYRPDIVINFAAQAGVRYSIENPEAYIQSNIFGFFNILECCRKYPVKHLVYASSSSVYGLNKKIPFEETDMVDQPASLYAVSKKTNELMAFSYSHLFGIPSTGLRFFTVYGPLGRPDMAYFSFTQKYFDDKVIEIYNDGDFNNDLNRDFTYIDDIIESLYILIDHIPKGEVPYVIFNIGNNNPERLMRFIEVLENSLAKSLGKKVEFRKEYKAMKQGDVSTTFASTDSLFSEIGFKPKTDIEVGLQRFADWYVDYYNKK
jgi:UDP-glucuronate 4-epimerase